MRLQGRKRIRIAIKQALMSHDKRNTNVRNYWNCGSFYFTGDMHYLIGELHLASKSTYEGAIYEILRKKEYNRSGYDLWYITKEMMYLPSDKTYYMINRLKNQYVTTKKVKTKR